jgi:hypothetical protein
MNEINVIILYINCSNIPENKRIKIRRKVQVFTGQNIGELLIDYKCRTD